MKHYPFGSSTAKRTFHCPAWRKLTDKYPPANNTNAAAERGTAMHQIMEDATVLGISVQEHLGKIEHSFEGRDIEHMLAAERMVETVFSKYQITEYEMERTMSIAPDVGGTADLLAWGSEHFVIMDYKFGRIEVDAKQNMQLVFANMMARNDAEMKPVMAGKKFVGVIIQPEISFEPDIYEFDEAELTALQEQLLNAINAARIGGEPRAGDHCEYCPALPHCPAQRAMAQQALLMQREQSASLAEALTLAYRLQDFIKTTEAEAFAAAEKGVRLQGFKLVRKKKTRKWDDDDTAAQALLTQGLSQAQVYDTSVRSPAQILALTKKAKTPVEIEDLLDKSEADLTLVIDSDPRDAVEVGIPTLAAALEATSKP
jgi:hypothetical protein